VDARHTGSTLIL